MKNLRICLTRFPLQLAIRHKNGHNSSKKGGKTSLIYACKYLFITAKMGVLARLD